MPVIYCFDIDGTICTPAQNSQYAAASPYAYVVEEINRLYDRGDIIKIMTARGSVSKVDYTDLTERQLKDWGVRYHELIMNLKPHADIFIDDRATNTAAWVQQIPAVRGVVAGSFDLIHPGYVKLFAEAKTVCTHLTVALHADPTLERPNKLRPILPVDDRELVLKSIRYVDDVVPYRTEQDLYAILAAGDFDVRFLGDDYRDREVTGADLDIDVHWIDRSHNYSTTLVKGLIYETVAEQK